MLEAKIELEWHAKYGDLETHETNALIAGLRSDFVNANTAKDSPTVNPEDFYLRLKADKPQETEAERTKRKREEAQQARLNKLRNRRKQ